MDGCIHPEASRVGLAGFEGGCNPRAQSTIRYDSAAPTVGDAELKGELKKMNKNLRQLIELKKQSNLIALGILALGFFYLMVISR